MEDLQQEDAPEESAGNVNMRHDFNKMWNLCHKALRLNSKQREALRSSVVFLIKCNMNVYSYPFTINFTKGATISINIAIKLTFK